MVLINLVWLFAFNYRIPGSSNKPNTPEYTVAETSAVSETESETQEEETMEAEVSENPAMAGTEDMAAKHKRCRVVQGTGLNVRSGPGSNYDIVTTVTSGTEMECLDEGESTWIHVRTLDGKEGYVSKGYVEMLED